MPEVRKTPKWYLIDGNRIFHREREYSSITGKTVEILRPISFRKFQTFYPEANENQYTESITEFAYSVEDSKKKECMSKKSSEFCLEAIKGLSRQLADKLEEELERDCRWKSEVDLWW